MSANTASSSEAIEIVASAGPFFHFEPAASGTGTSQTVGLKLQGTSVTALPRARLSPDGWKIWTTTRTVAPEVQVTVPVATVLLADSSALIPISNDAMAVQAGPATNGKPSIAVDARTVAILRLRIFDPPKFAVARLERRR